MPFYIKMNIQDYSNKSMINIHIFNDELNLIITIIIAVIIYIIINLINNRDKISNNLIKERSYIEIF